MSHTAMTSRQRVRRALNHQESDRVPFDLASTQVTGISNTAYTNLRRHLGLAPIEPDTMDVAQQVCGPHEDVMQRLQVDTRGLFPRVSTNWNIHLRDEGDAWAFVDE